MEKIKIYESKSKFEENVILGSIITFQIAGIDIAITKTKNGFFAFKDECPHNRVKLSEGKCNIYDEIVCPWHNYRFDLKTGMEGTNHGLFLKTYHLDINDEGVYLIL